MNFTPTMHKLSNGIAVFLDAMDIETVSMKIYVAGGARVETPSEYGITHFLEHMMFNGTHKYPTSKQGRDLLNYNGGTRGASTSNSRTEYHGRILHENFSVLLDVLSDMVLNPKLAAEDIEKEQGIVIQELKRSQDNPSRQFNAVVSRALFAGSYLERNDSLGTIETISSFSHDDLANYKNARYTANNMIIGISGKFADPDKILADLENLFGGIKSAADAVVNPGKLHPSVIYDVRDDKKQTKVFIGFESLYPDERKYDYEAMCLAAFDSALGHRLFESLIDKKGLAYEFGADGYGDRYLSADGFMTAMSPERLHDMIAGIASGCYDMLHRNLITIEEINRRNAMVKLGRADFFESSVRRCDKLIGFYANYGDMYDPAEFDAMRERINPDDIMKYSADVFSKPLSIIAQGPKCDIDLRAVWEENFK